MTTIIKTILTNNKRLHQNKTIRRIPYSLQADKHFSGAKFLPVFSLALLLSGCGSYSGSFDCPLGEGLKCTSLSEVNHKVDRGAVNLAFPSEKTDASCLTCQKIYWRDDLMHTGIHPHNRRR